MLPHSFNRFYVVTKFILPTIKELKFLMLNFDDKCPRKRKEHNSETKQHILDLIRYCRKICVFL